METGVVLLFVIIMMCMMVCMNLFSHYHDHNDSSNIEVQEMYGKPVKSLFISTEVFSFHQATEVTDENDQVVYYSNSKFLSLWMIQQCLMHKEMKYLISRERCFLSMEGIILQCMMECVLN